LKNRAAAISIATGFIDSWYEYTFVWLLVHLFAMFNACYYGPSNLMSITIPLLLYHIYIGFCINLWGVIPTTANPKVTGRKNKVNML
jgi:hypothetical protein